MRYIITYVEVFMDAKEIEFELLNIISNLSWDMKKVLLAFAKGLIMNKNKIS